MSEPHPIPFASRIVGIWAQGTVDPSTRPVILPPHQLMTKVTGDEKANFPRGEPVVSKFLVVIQIRNNRLG